MGCAVLDNEVIAMKINCGEYRQTMELLALKQRIEREDLEPRERQEIEKRIKELETELDLG